MARSNDLPARMDNKAGLVGELAHDLDADRHHHCDSRADIGAVGILHALAVDHDRRWHRLVPAPGASHLNKIVVQAFEPSTIT